MRISYSKSICLSHPYSFECFSLLLKEFIFILYLVFPQLVLLPYIMIAHPCNLYFLAPTFISNRGLRGYTFALKQMIGTR